MPCLEGDELSLKLTPFKTQDLIDKTNATGTAFSKSFVSPPIYYFY